MEPEGSLPLLQVPATCPSPEPDQSSPYPSCHFVNIRIIFPFKMIRYMVIQIFMFSYVGAIYILICMKNKSKYMNIVRRSY
jgi:hypothetical protein